MTVQVGEVDHAAQRPPRALRDAQGATDATSVTFDAVLLQAVDVRPAESPGDRNAGAMIRRGSGRPEKRDPASKGEDGTDAAVPIDPSLMPRVKVPALNLRDAAKLDVGAQAALEQQTSSAPNAEPAPDEAPAPRRELPESIHRAGRESSTQTANALPRAAGPVDAAPAEPSTNAPPTTPVRGTDAPGSAPGPERAASGAQAGPMPVPAVRPTHASAPGGQAARGVSAAGGVRTLSASQGSGQGAGASMNPGHAQSDRLLSRLQGRTPPSRTRPEGAPLPAQVGRALAEALRRGDGEATLHLRPEALGKVAVRLAVREGKVTASLTPETDSARRLLQDSIPDLRAALEARDLRVERITIEPVRESHGVQRQDADPSHTPMSTGGDSPGTQGGATHDGGAEARAGGGSVPLTAFDPTEAPETLGHAIGSWRAPFTLDGAGRIRVDALA